MLWFMQNEQKPPQALPAGFLSLFVLFFVFAQGAFRQTGEAVEPLVHHVPHTHGQMVTMTAMDGHALEAVAVMGAGLLAGTVVPGFPNLL